MQRVVICGAGFGGLELATLLSEAFGDEIDVTLIDRGDAFVFGFAKLDVMFGRKAPDEVKLRYSEIRKPGVTFRQESITAIDPGAKAVTTDRGTYGADVLVVALGADYDLAATPGLAEAGEFYSVDGATRMRDAIAAFDSGTAIVGVCGPFYKCPPAPFECALLLDTELRKRGVREACDIRIFSPLPRPIPPSIPTSAAIVAALEEHGITATFEEGIASIDANAKRVTLRSGGTVDYELFLGIPRHVPPAVLASSGLVGDDGFIAVDAKHLSTSFPDVYGVGDCAAAPVPRAGVFAEGQARAAFADIAAKLRGGEPAPYDGRGICYLEFGNGLVARIEADFYSGPSPVVPLVGPTLEFAAEKEEFGSSRRARWFS